MWELDIQVYTFAGKRFLVSPETQIRFNTHLKYAKPEQPWWKNEAVDPSIREGMNLMAHYAGKRLLVSPNTKIYSFSQFLSKQNLSYLNERRQSTLLLEQEFKLMAQEARAKSNRQEVRTKVQCIGILCK